MKLKVFSNEFIFLKNGSIVVKIVVIIMKREWVVSWGMILWIENFFFVGLLSVFFKILFIGCKYICIKVKWLMLVKVGFGYSKIFKIYNI